MMEQITIGQIILWGGALMTLVGIGEFLVKRFDKIMKHYTDKLDKRIDDIEATMIAHHTKTDKDIAMLKEVNYIMLSHMATNNNTREMQKVLDKYITENIK